MLYAGMKLDNWMSMEHLVDGWRRRERFRVIPTGCTGL